MEELGLLAGQRSVTQLLSGQNDGVQWGFELVRDCCMQNFVDVTQELGLIDFDLLSGLLHDNNLRVSLPESTLLGFDLEESILIAQLYSCVGFCIL